MPVRSRKKTAAVVAGVLLALFLVVGGTCGFLLYRSAMSVKADASSIMEQVDPLKEALQSGETEGLASSVATIQEGMSSINAEVHTPLWNLAAVVPVVGEDVRSVQKLGEAGSALVSDALVPIANSLSGTSLSDLMQNGAINVDLIRSLSASVSAALPVIEDSVDAIVSLPTAHLPQVAEVLERIQGPVADVQGLVGQLKPALDLLPGMLGADGQTRNYLVIAQNNSELRSTGGLPGSWGTLSVTNGVLSMGEFTSILHGEGMRVQLTDEELAAVGGTAGTVSSPWIPSSSSVCLGLRVASPLPTGRSSTAATPPRPS